VPVNTVCLLDKSCLMAQGDVNMRNIFVTA
jgi:hypothetical protein